MEKQKLIELINKGFTVRKMGDYLNSSFTNTRYWLKKYGLKTKTFDTENKKCKGCERQLNGRQRVFCSTACKSDSYKNSQRIYTNQQKRGWDRKVKLVDMFGGKCNRCGYNKNYSGLTFHHIDPTIKELALDVRNLSNRQWESIVNEVKKCELLCMNCHTEHHNPQHAIKIGAQGRIRTL